MTTRRRQSCRRKRRYQTRDAANQALTALITNCYASPEYMHVYRCGHCQLFHVGHKLGFGGPR